MLKASNHLPKEMLWKLVRLGLFVAVFGSVMLMLYLTYIYHSCRYAEPAKNGYVPLISTSGNRDAVKLKQIKVGKLEDKVLFQIECSIGSPSGLAVLSTSDGKIFNQVSLQSLVPSNSELHIQVPASALQQSFFYLFLFASPEVFKDQNWVDKLASITFDCAYVNVADIAHQIDLTLLPVAVPAQTEKLKELPSNDKTVGAQNLIDVRGLDLKDLQGPLTLETASLMEFDTNTVWPEPLPTGFNPSNILNSGMNPGLGIRRLHENGITGEGVGFGIIDQPALLSHSEYANRVKFYDSIRLNHIRASMHGTAVLSIGAGKKLGVAPGADIYHIGTDPMIRDIDDDPVIGLFGGPLRSLVKRLVSFDFNCYAIAIHRLLDKNKELAPEKRIRAISISNGFDKWARGTEEVFTAIKRARREGVFVISSSLEETYGFNFSGLGRNPANDPDEIASYEPGFWYKSSFFNNPGYFSNPTLLVPMDSRTRAGPSGENDFAFDLNGGWSWSIPYIAGMYILCCQVYPDVTPEEFWSAALKTGSTRELTFEGKSYELGVILNPSALISHFQMKQKTP